MPTSTIPTPSPTQLHHDLAQSHPSLSRGEVWCTVCGRHEYVNSAYALAGKRGGWPKCCGYTMTIDSPEERAAFKAQRAEAA